MFVDVILMTMTGSAILQLNLERYWTSLMPNMAWKPFPASPEVLDENFLPYCEGDCVAVLVMVSFASLPPSDGHLVLASPVSSKDAYQRASRLGILQ